MKLFSIAVIAMSALYLPQAHAQSQPVNTGLGQCVDFVIYGSSTLTGQVNGTTFPFVYGPSTYLDKPGQTVYIQNYSCASNDIPGLYTRVSMVGHEMGHLYLDQGWVLGTRDDYIAKACTNEGRAVLNNSTARNEILNTSQGSADIQLIAANTSALLAMIAAGGDNLAERVGDAFCTANVTSTTGENYKVYYGNEYDKLPNHPTDEEQ
ncbi:hypothetical protein [Xanthomonas translucens]|uniref:Secreted protein n=3 Tax=Xanthomonas campestris pv. translucens TaxID=343 RepID=A0A109HJ76_XANCT|nr:hypothetical protein [Xanthomonas translucens]KWV13238.1 hypothetical protein ATB53_16040 [Xanthomonas translucens]MCC8448257.1 hypothetical protein [Xanthomonas translucens pv. translucens]QSQ30716.1 hypothetical protein ISN30_02120 [Xanthomonas translucens pv. translucens]QSQ33465.1 hypothetical protein ISN31_16730 [Xanthomonas translucens pv. translucens]UNU11123.1 hypothetical protein KBV71_18615 [Xanthomonas translucens pv. translucens]